MSGYRARSLYLKNLGLVAYEFYATSSEKQRPNFVHPGNTKPFHDVGCTMCKCLVHQGKAISLLIPYWATMEPILLVTLQQPEGNEIIVKMSESIPKFMGTFNINHWPQLTSSYHF